MAAAPRTLCGKNLKDGDQRPGKYRTEESGLVWGMVSRKSFCIGNLKEEWVLNYVKSRMRHSRRRKQLALDRSMAYLRSQSSRQMDGPSVCHTE